MKSPTDFPDPNEMLGKRLFRQHQTYCLQVKMSITCGLVIINLSSKLLDTKANAITDRLLTELGEKHPLDPHHYSALSFNNGKYNQLFSLSYSSRMNKYQ